MSVPLRACGDVAAPLAAPRPVRLYAGPTEYSTTQLVTSWLASFSENTAAAYHGDLRLYFAWCADHDLDPLTVGLPEVQVFGLWLAQDPSPRTGRVRAGSSVTRALAAVSSWYTYCNRVGAMHHQPAAHAQRPPRDRHHSATRGLSEWEARQLCLAARTDAPRTWPPLCAQLAVHLLIDLGARESEVCGVNLADLGHRPDDTGTSWRVITLRMKGGTVRVRPIPLQLGPLLDAWRTRRVADPSQVALLVDRDGRRLNRFQVIRLVARLAAAAGIPDPHEITPHSCRHAFTTIARGRGADLEQRQRALGHKSPTTTQLYDHTAASLATDPAHLVAAATFAP